MNNKIKEVKERADIVKVAQYFNIKLNRSNKALCPFSNHKEKTPSFSISPQKQIFHCFGCGIGGDCITLVSKLVNISPYEAAKQINNILGLGINFEGKTSNYELNKYKQEQLVKEKYKKWEKETFVILTDYLHKLKEWKEIKDPENERYIEALQQIDYIEYIINECFIEGTDEDKIWFWKHESKVVKQIEARSRTNKTIDE